MDIRIDKAFFADVGATARFILARHGESAGNAAAIFQGRTEHPLTEKGREQASSLGLALAKHRGAKVLCSPLGRARETAELAARAAGFSAPQIAQELTELDTGSFTGRSWDDIRENEHDAWLRFRTESWEAVDGAENCAALYARAERAWLRMKETARSEAARARPDADGKKNVSVVAISHGGFLQWLVRVTFGSRTWFPLIPMHNCGIYVLRVEPVSETSAALFWETMGEETDL